MHRSEVSNRFYLLFFFSIFTFVIFYCHYYLLQGQSKIEKLQIFCMTWMPFCSVMVNVSVICPRIYQRMDVSVKGGNENAELYEIESND